ncbi:MULTISPECIES: 16S rRNA (uracil(1498)-N(3))-methyltransferase [unclassified Oceanobacter]|jgi:16S rRNA (uracil1498-N3)-methyltransferase|uniref:16S rRNA (uracil(1498)-N(3))-methyltransferase n=1 Tax=unclassified Oceanobacter TaxID=2620260 RepID=UPI0027344D5D|nr:MULTISPECIES: 16S rRNA (uracil(1498)-N(3))-methyltransferase [unclassified Oceanobacter]MDP2547182.1 16S rRNA (uracil(1498)-N(3))-methyltransferase [Oceanobacter sp. 4_MG-2023]MDP2609399.1 16S rRNA (uracil(1498)-N(3))-methyltransferase [Oceanobacter sp. 1_MG-2023]MDP2612782.1 16S rRNA (uracil(1498)-N(3))-methyltransferase [Oceanobacter sp. 2_MG-2023]
MSSPRIFTNQPLIVGQTVTLDEQPSLHLLRVLRLTVTAPVRLFNGDGCEYQGTIATANKKQAEIHIVTASAAEAIPPLPLHLGQVISKGDKMDFTIQKATELGVSQITPLFSERCDVRLKGERLEKKIEHWQKVALSACEQSGRNRIPQVLPALSLNDWYARCDAERRLILHPHNQQPLQQAHPPASVALLVGPEGGLTDTEVAAGAAHGFQGLLLGPRILRTETAALAAVSVLQFLWGDF